MAVSEHQLDEAHSEARLKILQAIAEQASGSTVEATSRTVLNLAESYAWLTAVQQPHGSRSS